MAGTRTWVEARSQVVRRLGRWVALPAGTAMLLGGCGSDGGDPPTALHDGAEVHELWVPPCDDADACAGDTIWAGSTSYRIVHPAEVRDVALGQVHGIAGSPPVRGVEEARTIEGVPTDLALAGRVDARWVVLEADSAAGDGRDVPGLDALCSSITSPETLPACADPTG